MTSGIGLLFLLSSASAFLHIIAMLVGSVCGGSPPALRASCIAATRSSTRILNGFCEVHGRSGDRFAFGFGVSSMWPVSFLKRVRK